MKGAVILVLVLQTCICTCSAAAEGPGEAKLISDVVSIQSDTPFMAGIWITMPDRWHTYWMNPGDSGMAPEMTWRLPEGFVAEPLLWPFPTGYDEPPILSFGYEHDVLLFREIRPPSHLIANSNYTFEVTLSWMVCKEICIPKTAHLRLTLPSREELPVPSIRWQSAFKRAREELPIRDPKWKFRTVADVKTISLYVTPFPDVELEIIGRSFFFPAQPNLVEYESQTWIRSENEYVLHMKRISGDEPLPARMRGVLVLPPGKKPRALEVDTTFQPTAGER